jgi:hypothetical protein
MLFFGLIQLLFTSWPPKDDPDDKRWFMVVLCAGALGSYVHVARSAAAYIGNQALVVRWLYWYLLRLPVGAILSLLIFMLMRGDAFFGAGERTANDPFSMVGIAALAGLFADGTVKKLTDWFNLLLRAKDDSLKDPLESNNPLPKLSGVAPPEVPAAGGKVTLYGEKFQATSAVLVNGRLREPSTIAKDTLTLEIQSEDVAGQATLDLRLATPDPKVSSIWHLTERVPLKIRAPRQPSGDQS